jgi:hypothetical protein
MALAEADLRVPRSDRMEEVSLKGCMIVPLWRAGLEKAMPPTLTIR